VPRRFTLVVLGGLLMGCGGSGMHTTRLAVGSASLKVELAIDPGDQARGLMYRKKLGSDRGMLFVYEAEEHRSFWMKNTYIPLSIAYIDADREIVHITDMLPRSLESHPSLQPCQFALEVNRGWFDEHEVDVGDRVEFEIPAKE
jgi:uncharacterized protein